MEDAVVAVEVELVLRDVETRHREVARVLLLQRRVVVVGVGVPARRIVAALEERAEELRPDEPGRAGDEVAHGPEC